MADRRRCDYSGKKASDTVVVKVPGGDEYRVRVEHVKDVLQPPWLRK